MDLAYGEIKEITDLVVKLDGCTLDTTRIEGVTAQVPKNMLAHGLASSELPGG